MSTIHPRYIIKNPSEEGDITTSIPVLRASDNANFLASKFPNVIAQQSKPNRLTTTLASAVLPTAATSLSRILNHPNLISLIDIVHTSALPGSVSERGKHGDITIWEDMDAGSLAYLVPATSSLPDFTDDKSWFVLASQNYHRFSLPESLCWHVLRSIARALLWLHHGVKESADVPGEWTRHDQDWQPILIMDVSPSQVWFKQPRGEEFYGECKLGGFQWARVTGGFGESVPTAPRVEEADREKQYYWAPEVYQETHAYSRSSEIWALGATVYTMMTGMPPPRMYDYNWQASRMTDKGFTQGLREVLRSMLKPHPMDRPTALQLVDKIEDEWRRWRATTREGQWYVDVGDKLAARGVRDTRVSHLM